MSGGAGRLATVDPLGRIARASVNHARSGCVERSCTGSARLWGSCLSWSQRGRCCMARSAGAVRLVDRLSSGLLAGALMTIAGRVDTPADRRWCMNRYPTGWRPVGRVHHGLQHGADDVKALDGPSHLQDQVPGHQLARVRPGAGPTGGEPVLCDRDVHLERIGEAGRRRWRLEAGQHHQSRAANTFYRYSG